MRALLLLVLVAIPAGAATVQVGHAYSGSLPLAGGQVAWLDAPGCRSDRFAAEEHVVALDGMLRFQEGPSETACVEVSWRLPRPDGAHALWVEVQADRGGPGGPAAPTALLVVHEGNRTIASRDLWGHAEDGTVTTRLQGHAPADEARLLRLLFFGSAGAASRIDVHRVSIGLDSPTAAMEGTSASSRSWLGGQVVGQQQWGVEVPPEVAGLHRDVVVSVPAHLHVQGVIADGRELELRTRSDPVTGTATVHATLPPGPVASVDVVTLVNRIPGDAASLWSLFAAAVGGVLLSAGGAVQAARRLSAIPGTRRALLWGTLAGVLTLDALTLWRIADPGVWRLMVTAPLVPIAAGVYAGLATLALAGALFSVLAWRRAHQRVSQSASQQARAVEELARVNLELDRFSAALVHDLKGPLSACATMTQRVLEAETHRMDARSRDALARVVASMWRVHRMVGDLLDLAEMQAHADAAEVELADAVQDAMQALGPRIEQVGAQVQTGPLGTVWADRALLARLLQNLMENAIEHRGQQPPRIHITLARRAGEDLILVEDNGPGIPGDLLAPDGRNAPVRARRGLGLAIVGRIVSMHRGTVEVHSRPGSGTLLQVCLPRPPPTRPARPESSAHLPTPAAAATRAPP